MTGQFLRGLLVGGVLSATAIAFLTGRVSEAQSPPEPETKQDATTQMEQAQVIQVQAMAIADDFAVLKAFVRDQDLAKGFAPEGWTQPDFSVYEAELDGRPSMLPYENFMVAVGVGVCSPEEGVQYALWVEAQNP